jgi:hypothetical protein
VPLGDSLGYKEVDAWIDSMEVLKTNTDANVASSPQYRWRSYDGFDLSAMQAGYW